MEKFRKFADPATGINPFLNLSSSSKKSFVGLLQTYIFGFLLFLVKIPLFLALVFWLVLFSNVIVPLLCVPSIQRYTTLINNIFCYRILLLFLGFFSLEGISRKLPKMNSGTLILVSHSSPIDFFLLNYLASPIYLNVSIYPNGEVSIRNGCGVLTGIIDPKAFNFSEKLGGKSLKEVVREAGELKKGPLVLFFEGARTNATGLLEVEKGLMEEIHLLSTGLESNIVLLSIEYLKNSMDFSPINIHNNNILHLIKLIASPRNHLKIRATTLIKGENIENKITNFYVSSKRPQLKVGWREFRGFLDYYSKTRGKSYAKLEKKN